MTKPILSRSFHTFAIMVAWFCLVPLAWAQATMEAPAIQPGSSETQPAERPSPSFFGLTLGMPLKDQLVRISKTNYVEVNINRCNEITCILSSEEAKSSGKLFLVSSQNLPFVFETTKFEVSPRRSIFDPNLWSSQIKSKSDIPRVMTTPSFDDIAVQVASVEIRGASPSMFDLYVKNGVLIAIRPINDSVMKSLPLEYSEMTAVLSSRYQKLPTLLNKIDRSTNRFESNKIERWKAEDEVTIRLHSYQRKVPDYERCIRELALGFRGFGARICANTDEHVLVYSINGAFDRIEGDIKLKTTEITDEIWSKTQSFKGKF